MLVCRRAHRPVIGDWVAPDGLKSPERLVLIQRNQRHDMRDAICPSTGRYRRTSAISWLRSWCGWGR